MIRPTLTTILALFISISSSFCQEQETARSLWTEVSKEAIRDNSQRASLPKSYRVFELQLEGIRESLVQAPMEFSSQAQSSETIAAEIIGRIVQTNATYREGNRLTLLDMDFNALIANPELMQKLEQLDAEQIQQARELLKNVEGIRIELNELVEVRMQ